MRVTISTRTKTALLLFLVVFVIFALTASEKFSLDAAFANFASWHLVSTGSPWIEGTGFYANIENRDTWVILVNGHEVVARAPGVIIFSMPAYWIAQSAEFTNGPAGITAALISACSVIFMYLAVASKLSNKLSVVVALVFGLATPVWAISADTMWPHTITVFGIAGMAWAASKERWWLVGVFGGVALTGRVHVAIIVAVIGLGVGLMRKRPDVVIKVAVPSLVFLGLTGLWNRWLYDSWNPTGAYRIDGSTQIAERYESLLVNQLGMWFAPDRGIFVWTPVLLVLMPALVRSWPELPDWSKWLAAGGFVYTLVQGWANAFHGGDAFWSYRLGLEFVACAAPAFAFSVPKSGALGRKVAVGVVGLQIVGIGLGAILGIPGLPYRFAWTQNSLIYIFVQQPLAGLALLAAIIWLSMRIGRLIGPLYELPENQSEETLESMD